jgi:hypothetical protein
MIESQSLDNLRVMLLSAGHELAEPGSTDVRVCPTPDLRIVVATQPDVTLYPAHRRHFFLCRPRAESILIRAGCPFTLCRQWSELLVRMHGRHSREVLAGPGTWLLSRLIKHDPILIWGVGSGYWEQSYCDSEYEVIENELGTRIDFGPWRKHLIEGTCQTTHYLSPQDEQFPHILAAYLLLSSYNFFEFYLANINCTEVYEIHHHDKVTASVPVPELKVQILKDLTANPDLYIDVSGYHCAWDGEEDEDEEGNGPIDNSD